MSLFREKTIAKGVYQIQPDWFDRTYPIGCIFFSNSTSCVPEVIPCSKVSTSEEVVVTVDITHLRFSPSSVTITEGDSVRFFWSGELLAHNAVAEDGLFDSGDTSRNVDYTFTFEAGTNGTHQYVCEPHESVGMVGTVIVEPMQEPVSPEPANDTSDPALSKSGESWIPFFGLEIVVLVMVAALIFQLGKAQGIGDVRLLSERESKED